MAPKSRKKRKNRTKDVKKVAIPFEEKQEDKQAPHSFVITRGNRSRALVHICQDFRRIMEPNTAINLKERRCNKIKDFVSLSGIFHVSYLCIFSQTEQALLLKIAKMAKGPTLTFKVHEHTLAKDIVSTMKSQFVNDEAFHHAPVVILNGFSGEGRHLKLMAATFQNMFPPINLSTIKLYNVKRCLLFSFDATTKLIEIRHYFIRCQPVGINKNVRKLVNRQIPDLSNFEDVSEFVTRAAANAADSEGEEDERTVELTQTLGRGNMEGNKSEIRLYEIGPRFTIQLIKIEEGLMEGEVFFHEYVQKTDEEVEEIIKRREKRKRLKEQRKKKMQEDIEAKKKAKELHKKRSMGIKDEDMEEEQNDEIEDEDQEPENDSDEDNFDEEMEENEEEENDE